MITTENRERTVTAYFEQLTPESFSQLVKDTRMYAAELLAEKPPALVAAMVQGYLIKKGYPQKSISRIFVFPYTICIKDIKGKSQCIFDVSSTDVRFEQLKERRKEIFNSGVQGFCKDPELCFKEIELIVKGLEVRGWCYSSIKEVIVSIMTAYCPEFEVVENNHFDLDAVKGSQKIRLYDNFVKEVPIPYPDNETNKSEKSYFEANAFS